MSAFAEPLIMDNDKDLVDMCVHSYVTPPEEETADDLGYDYGGCQITS